MANLYLVEQGSVLRKTSDRLIVQKQEEKLLEIQCSKIDGVLIFGNVQFTTQAVHELFEHGIEMALFTRTGKLIGQLTSPSTKNIELRIEQFKKYDDLSFKLKLSQTLVTGKLNNGLSLIKSYFYNHQETDLAYEISRLKTSLNDIDRADNLNSLLGVEGSASVIYFKGFSKMVHGDFTFVKRVKRPPTDPVNALLSFGYTLLYNEISSLLDGLGFDPYLGYFHKPRYGRASLAADIQEEFRPAIDRFTLYLTNNRLLKKEDFYTNPKSSGVYLKKEAMKKYFVEYEKYMNRTFIHNDTKENTTMRKCFRIQAEKLAKFIKNEADYTPFNMVI